jgi:hypothetical protein
MQFKNLLKVDWHELTEDNLVDHVEAAICQLTGQQCRGFFHHTGH